MNSPFVSRSFVAVSPTFERVVLVSVGMLWALRGGEEWRM
jgi:hypothetical protein